MTTKFDEWARIYNEFRTVLYALSIAGMFGTLSPLQNIFRGLGSIFGAEGTIASKWKLLKESGLIVLHRHKKTKDDIASKFTIKKSVKYGISKIIFIKIN